MVLVQKWHFFQLFFLTNIFNENVFYDILEQKTSFQPIKTRSSKSPKIDIFPKGLTYSFGRKMDFFPTFLLDNIGKENVFYDILERKNAFLGYKKRITDGFGPKMAIFPLLFQAIQARKISFSIFQNEKTPFQALKTTSSKSPKLDIFPKGLTHYFRPKMAIFRSFFFQAVQARKMSLTIFQSEKTLFYSIKTRSSKSQKIDMFSKGLTHGFGPKMDIFPNFFFRHYSQGKCLLRCSRTKKRLSRI